MRGIVRAVEGHLLMAEAVEVAGFELQAHVLAKMLKPQPKVTSFALDRANKALAAVKSDAINGASVIVV